MSSKKLIIILPILALVLSACSVSTSNNSSGPDSSVFVSTDKGNTWRPAASTPSANGQPGSISGLNVRSFSIDPSDNQAVYLNSYDSGLFFTYNIAEGWRDAKGLPKSTIQDSQVDPKAKCNIYAAIDNRVYRSSDCARTWTQVYYDNNPGVLVHAIAIDHYNPNNIYIGTSRGEVIKSIDQGGSWRTIERLNGEGVFRIIVSPLDSRSIFVASTRNKIYSFRSSSATNPANSADVNANFAVDNWTDLSAVLKGFNLGSEFKDLAVANDGTIFLASSKLILRSKDNGITWENINLLQPDKDAIINALAVNPLDAKEFYYVTNTTFFKTADAGTTWSTKKLTGTRAGSDLLVDFKSPNIIYLATRVIKK